MDNLDSIFEQAGAKRADQEPEGQGGEQQTQTQESSKEEPVQQSQEPQTDPNEGQQQEPAQEDTKQEGEGAKEQSGEGQSQEPQLSNEDILKRINEHTGANFESLDDVKGLLSTKDKLKEYESTLEQKDEALKKAGDPYQTFADEKILKANEIVRKNEGVTPDVAFKLASSDLDNMNDDDVLVMEQIMNNPHYAGRESELKDIINEDYGLDEFGSEDDMEEADKKKLSRRQMKKEMAAKKARESLKQMASVETPGQRDLEAETQQEKEQQQKEFEQKVNTFRPQANKMLEDVGTLKFGKNGHEYQVDQAFMDTLGKDDNLAKFLANNYDANDPNAYNNALQKVKQMYWANNPDRIVDDLEEQIKARMQDQVHKEQHNPKENNRQEKPQASDAQQRNAEETKRLINDLKGL